MQDNRTFFPTQDQVVSSGNGCPEQTEKSGHIPGRSLCPWYIDMNRQRDRIPYLIPYARCKCRRCLNVPVDSPLNRFARCEYHYYHMQVLRRLSCKNGFYIYKAFWEQVPVACICAHRKIAVTGWNMVERQDQKEKLYIKKKGIYSCIFQNPKQTLILKYIQNSIFKPLQFNVIAAFVEPFFQRWHIFIEEKLLPNDAIVDIFMICIHYIDFFLFMDWKDNKNRLLFLIFKYDIENFFKKSQFYRSVAQDFTVLFFKWIVNLVTAT